MRLCILSILSQKEEHKQYKLIKKVFTTAFVSQHKGIMKKFTILELIY